MSTIFSLAGLNASDYAFVNNANQELVYAGAQQYLGMVNEATTKAISAFVDPMPTTSFQERYKLPMAGRMQRVSEISTGKAVTPSGSWDVGYPLHNYHEQIVIGDVDSAYMTPQEFQNHVDGVAGRARNAKRHEILLRLFNNAQTTVTDKRHGTLTIEALANGDTVVYPPVEGSDTEATENHYLGSGYATTAISDTNNPIKTLVNDLTHHGTPMTDDVPVATFINSAQQDAVEALTNFVPYIPRQIQGGMDTDQVLMPSRPIPGKVIGYIRGLSWVSVWDWVPAAYMMSVNLAAPQPLKMRVDPAETGLGNGGLQLLQDERHGVLTFDSWRLRFGVGTSNRLGAAVMFVDVGGSYVIPSAYS